MAKPSRFLKGKSLLKARDSRPPARRMSAMPDVRACPRCSGGQDTMRCPYAPVSIGNDSSLTHSDIEPSYTATRSCPASRQAKASMVAEMPPPQ